MNLINLALTITFLNYYTINLIRAQDRECDCDLKFQIGRKKYDHLTENFKLDNVRDQRDTCDFKCIEWCSREIRDRIGGDPNEVTNDGRENMCEIVSPNRTVYKDGIELSGHWHLTRCTLNKVVLDKNICCRHCSCKLTFSNPKSKADFDVTEEIIDLSIFITRQRSFICETVDHIDECENDCRKLVADQIDFEPINQIKTDNYDTLTNRNESNRICEYLDRKINSPGIDLKVRIESGPRNESWHKDISLGNLCCQRTCECELIYRSDYLQMSKSNNYVINLMNYLPKRPISYYCDEELSECVEDCKIAAGIHLRNELIKNPLQSALDLKIFSNFTTARRACVLYGQKAKKPNGVDVYLRYSTGFEFKKFFPYTQDLFLGNLCCDTYFDIDLFPFNKCADWHWSDLPEDFVDD